MRNHKPFRIIFTARLIYGTLDGLSAIAVAAYSGVGPIRVFQGISSGLLGRSSFHGGLGTAVGRLSTCLMLISSQCCSFVSAAAGCATIVLILAK